MTLEYVRVIKQPRELTDQVITPPEITTNRSTHLCNHDYWSQWTQYQQRHQRWNEPRVTKASPTPSPSSSEKKTWTARTKSLLINRVTGCLIPVRSRQRSTSLHFFARPTETLVQRQHFISKRLPHFCAPVRYIDRTVLEQYLPNHHPTSAEPCRPTHGITI